MRPDQQEVINAKELVFFFFQLLIEEMQIQDISGGCGSMYAIEVASPKFKGLTMMKQHRLVQEILDKEIKGWHGLQLRTKVE